MGKNEHIKISHNCSHMKTFQVKNFPNYSTSLEDWREPLFFNLQSFIWEGHNRNTHQFLTKPHHTTLSHSLACTVFCMGSLTTTCVPNWRIWVDFVITYCNGLSSWLPLTFWTYSMYQFTNLPSLESLFSRCVINASLLVTFLKMEIKLFCIVFKIHRK